MKTKNYLILCAAISVVLVLTLSFVPSIAIAVEQSIHLFLVKNAS